MSVFVLLILVVIVACLIVATVLGWIAVSKIRRSQGRLSGLGLAVFDGLLFPLLLLDGLIVAAGTTLSKMFVAFFANPALQNRPEADPALATKIANILAGYAAVSFLVIALIVIVVDYLIIRSVWRAVNKPITPLRADAHVPTIGQEAPANFPSLERSGSRPAAGWWRVPLVVAIVFYAAFMALLLFTADALPGRVASHFGENGQPNGWMSRTGHIEFMAILPLAIGLLFAGIVAMIRKLPQGLINIPRKDFWLAPGRRDLTASIIASRFAWFYGLLLCFFGGLHVLTLKANSAQPAQLPMGGFLFLVIGFLIATMMWTILLITRFAETKDPRDVTSGATSARSSDASAPLRFSRTAIVGSCLMALGVLSAVLSLFVDRMVASADGLAQPHHPASPAALALISAALLYACLATLLGWIAVTQIRRSAGRLYGLGLAVFDGLFLPLLALDALILSTGVGLDVSFVIIVVADIFIIRAVWHAVNKPAVPPAPPPAYGVTTPPPSPEVPTIGNAAPADFQSLETTNAVLMTPEELGTARGQFGMAFTRGPLVLDGTRLVHRGNGKDTVIPLAAIEDVSLGHFPRAMNPRHMELVCVTYRLDGRTQRIVFAPWERMVGLPSLFNERVRAWHQLVRSAVHRNTGRMPTETAEEQLNLPRSSPLTIAVMASPFIFGIGALWAAIAVQSASNLPGHLRWLLWMPALPLLVMALAWITPKRRATTAAKPRSILLALMLPVLAAAIGVGSFVVGMLLRPHIQPPIGPFKVHCTPEGVTGRVVLVRMFTPDPLVRQELRMHLEGPELPVDDLLIPRNFSHRPRPDYFIFPRPSPAIQPWTDFGSSKQTLMGFVLPTPELAQEAWRRLGMGAQPMAFDRDRPPGAFHFDLDPTRPEYLNCILFDVTNAVGEHFTGKLLFSATWVRAGHPRWAEVKIRPIKKSLNTIELAWEVVTEKPAAMTLRHRWQDGGSETMAAFTQSSPNVHASVLVYKMTDTRVGMRMTLGDQPSTKEFDGNFEAIAGELGVYSGGGRIKTERDWDIELCRVAKEPVYLHISDLKEPEIVVGSQGRR